MLNVAGGMPILERLPATQVERLADMGLGFLRRKTLEGAGGLTVEAPIAATIALQACLPVLELGLELYTGWHALVLYPDEFRAPYDYADEAGVVHQGSRDLTGEAWDRGPVVLAWSHVADDAVNPEPAGNVVIHEMAHKLDLLNGEVNGMPPLHRDMAPRVWAETMASAYDDLVSQWEEGLETPIDPYAGHSPGEFFAVTSELFFAWPECLNEAYPEVYGQLARYYRQDPLRRAR
jgi:Mlc titration factor MtfA (ptsG expression regulator)